MHVAGTPIALSDRDLRTMVSITDETDHAATEPGVRLPWSVLHRIKDLLGCDELICHDLEAARRRISFAQTTADGCDDLDLTPGGATEPTDQPFWATYWSGSCSYPDRTGDLRSVVTPYDFASERQWRESPAYREYFGPLGTKHTILLTLPDRPGRTVRLVAFRDSGPRFSERDRAVLTLLRPHVYAAYLQLARRRNGEPNLTDRQWQLLQLVALGHTNARIARQLGVSEGTVRKHMENIHARLGVSSRAAALARAFPERFAVAWRG